MRLTGGDGKGRRLLDAPPNVRPTSGKVREQLMFLLRDELEDASVLDLFAGTGALGLEAVARGAARAVFVEQNRDALRTIQGNVKRCRFEDRCEVLSGDVFVRLRQPFTLQGPHHLIFADPPYQENHLTTLLELLQQGRVLHAGGVFVYETRIVHDPVEQDGWELIDDRRLGSTRVLMYTPGE